MVWKDGAIYKITEEEYAVVWKEKGTKNYFVDIYDRYHISDECEYNLADTFSIEYAQKLYNLDKLKIAGYENKGFILRGNNSTILINVKEKIKKLKKEIKKLKEYLK